MKYLLIASCALISACSGLIYKPATTEQLQAMSTIEVCKEVGEAKWRGNAEAYITSQKEASKRIAQNEISETACSAITEMKMKQNDRAQEYVNKSQENNKTTHTNCVATGNTANCTSVTH